MFQSSLFIMLFAACSVYCNVTSIDSINEINSNMNEAILLILKAKDYIPNIPEGTPLISRANDSIPNIPKENKKPTDCADILEKGQSRSGVYKIWPTHSSFKGKSLNVYCDMATDGGGWTVIQRRGDFGSPKEYFDKGWQSYKEGFGDIEKDFWLGNDNIFALTNQKQYSARFDLEDVEQNRRYALYDTFRIDDEKYKYTLHISDYSGDAGDSMISMHNAQKFSTKDRDNDNFPSYSCAEVFNGGWWYNGGRGCLASNLNGLYDKGSVLLYAYAIYWQSWKGRYKWLQWTEIKIRPKNFKT